MDSCSNKAGRKNHDYWFEQHMIYDQSLALTFQDDSLSPTCRSINHWWFSIGNIWWPQGHQLCSEYAKSYLYIFIVSLFFKITLYFLGWYCRNSKSLDHKSMIQLSLVDKALNKILKASASSFTGKLRPIQILFKCNFFLVKCFLFSKDATLLLKQP
jgi:hypothetical protein